MCENINSQEINASSAFLFSLLLILLYSFLPFSFFLHFLSSFFFFSFFFFIFFIFFYSPPLPSISRIFWRGKVCGKNYSDGDGVGFEERKHQLSIATKMTSWFSGRGQEPSSNYVNKQKHKQIETLREQIPE